MAMYAALTGSDGTNTTTVYLRRCTAGDDLIGLPDGYRQKIAKRRQDGAFDKVTETWALQFTSNSDVDRADALIDLGNLRQLCWRKADDPTLDADVWLQVQTPTEHAARYGIVTDIYIPELDARHWRSNALPELRIEIERQGLWWGTSPRATSWPYNTGATTLYNQNSSGATIKMSVTAANQGGDAPGLVGIKAGVSSRASDYVNYRFGVKRFKSTTSYTNFNPHFNPVNEISGLHQVTDASAPGGKRIYYYSTSSVNTTLNFTWNLPGSATLADYAGTYLVYASAVSDFDTSQLAFLYNGEQISSFVDMPDKASIPASVWNECFVGVVTLPRSGAIPHSVTPVNPTLGLRVKLVGAAYDVFDLRHWWLIPVTDGYGGALEVWNSSGATKYLWLDGWHKKAYLRTDTGLGSGGTMGPEWIARDGQWLATSPGTVMGLYFFASKKNTSYDGYYMDGNITSSVTICTINRYQSLRD